MSMTTEDRAAHRPTIREQANASRIGRARFIGNLIGYIVLAALVLAGAMLAKLTEPLPLPAGVTLKGPPPMIPNHYVLLGVLAVLHLALLDLGVRRRHDRGRSGIDVFIWLLLTGALAATHIFGWVGADLLRIADIGVAVISVYFLVVLVLLPGKDSENRYGPPEEHAPPV